MNPPSWPALFQAELRKLMSRTSARVGLLLAVAIGLGLPIARGAYQLLVIQIAARNGGDVSLIPPADPTVPIYAALWLRNFFVMRVLLIMVGALSFAGEFQSRTLREDLLRPVSRPAVLMAKWAALVAWVGGGLVLTGATSTLASVIAFPGGEGFGHLLLQYAVALLADAGFAAVVLMVAVLSRSVAGTLAGMFLFYLLDLAVAIGFGLLASLPDQVGLPPEVRAAAGQVSPWLPSAAFAAWNGGTIWSGGGDWSVPAFVSLGVVTLVSLAVAIWRFERLDVP